MGSHAPPPNMANRGRWVALFPLTPALSFGEREPRSPALEHPEHSEWASTRPRILPLPKGEGRGEGEEHTRSIGTYECEPCVLSTQL
jgi:hypothetical protein